MKTVYYIFILSLMPFLVLSQDARNYGLNDGTFNTGTNSSLTSMASGTSILISSGQVNVSSSVTNIGFDIWFGGARYTQFSVNCNGILRFGNTVIAAGGNTPSIAGQARIVPLSSGSFVGETSPLTGNFQTAPSTGKVHYKIIGTAPNRVLVVEWLNMEIGHRSALASYATFQAHIYETAPAPTTTDGGTIQFIYGRMPSDARNSSNTQITINTRTGIGFGANTGEFLHTITSTNPPTVTGAFNGTSTLGTATGYENNLSAGANVPNLHSTSASARRFLRYEAPDVIGVPSNAQASCITNSTIDLEWVDPGTTNGVGIVIYRSTDGTNFSFLTQTAIGAQTFQDTGLTPNVTYYYRLYVVNEGKLSTLGGQASVTVTTAGGGATTAYAIRDGNWNSASTWSTGSAPSATTDVIIGCGYTVTLNPSNAECNDLTILSGAAMDFSNNGGITVNGDFSNIGTIDFTGNNPEADFKGDIANSGLWIPAVATITTSGSSLQSISNSGTSTYSTTITTGEASEVYSTTGTASIPDNTYNSSGDLGCSGAVSSFTGANSASMSLVVPAGRYTLESVSVSISHTYNADLDIWVAPPGSTIAYQLSSNNGGAGTGYSNVTFSDNAATSITTAPAAVISGSYIPECTTLSSITADGGTWTLYVTDEGPADIGDITDFSVTVTPAAEYSTTGSASIPDNAYNSSGALGCSGATGSFTAVNSASLSLTVPAGTYTLDYVSLSISHTYNSDLDIWLVPAGSAIAYQLSSNNGGAGTGYSNVTFSDNAASSITTAPAAVISGSYIPECTTLSSVTATGGTWTLYVTDEGPADIGTITDFAVGLFGTTATSNVTVNHLSFYDLIVNNTGAGIVSNDTITIINDMDFTDGIVDIGGHEVRFLDGTTSEVGSNDSHVNGQVRKVGDDAFTFPVGNGAYVAQCGISAPSSVSDEFTANYTRQNPVTANYYPLATDGTIENVSRTEYWDIDRAVGASSVFVSLSYDDTRSEGVADTDSLVISHWSGTQWDNEGNSAVFGGSYTGITSSAAMASFSPFTLGNIGTSSGNINILPITLVDFRANKLESDAVHLAWQTSSEVNSSHFLVERSFDGIEFLPIGEIDAQGESKDIKNYTLLDTDGELPNYSTVYYRLKMIDLDETFEYSRVRQVHFGATSFEIITVYPNPFGTATSVKFSLPENGQVEWVVYDLLGRAVQSKAFSGQAGVNEFELDNWGNLPGGTYILMGVSQGKKLTKKIIKLGN